MIKIWVLNPLKCLDKFVAKIEEFFSFFGDTGKLWYGLKDNFDFKVTGPS